MMKSKKTSKRKQVYYRKDDEPVRIKERKKRTKKFNKNDFYDLIEPEDDLNLGLSSKLG